MKEVIVHPFPSLHTTIHDVPVPEPGPNEVVIKVIVAGSNPKDIDHLISANLSLNSGDDLAGLIHSVGSEIEETAEWRAGDRVAAFHPMMTEHGAYAEYAVVSGSTVIRLPTGMGFEEAATLPLVLTTSAISLFRRQRLPPPWSPLTYSTPTPIIIYGASSAVGTFAIKLARISNLHPIIAIAGSSTTHLLPLLDASKGDTLVDYRLGVDEMKRLVKEKLNGAPCHHALDCISSKGTWIPVSHMLSPSTSTQTSYLSVTSGANQYNEPEIPEGVKVVYTYVGTAHAGKYRQGMPMQDGEAHVKGDPEWTWLFYRYVGRMLADGRLSGHPFQVVDGGLEGIEKGLGMLRRGEVGGRKLVYRVGEI
ncbi:trans-enoyl reductase [Hyphodiscus hymeniophilus]|uniref:Trans-enoyl reductase n=1 Tax=Hyphodiscus hymeniophilus TaxID=353542 RepID=A0A9P7AZX9_9HELO|nr:trans-enoyl reductase [Hyphodiscus hymeniophilus]